MQIKNFSVLVATVLLAALGATVHAGEMLVIVSAANPVLTMGRELVADIFLGQSGQFPDGREAVALDQNMGSDIRDEFYRKVAARSPPLLKAYWTKMIFTGRGQPPREVPTSLAVRKLVAENPNLIGYIDRSALDASVKVVLPVP